jgi:hypothetical protein
MGTANSATDAAGSISSNTKINVVRLSGVVTKPGVLSTIPGDGREFAEATLKTDQGEFVIRAVGASAQWLATARKNWTIQVTGSLKQEKWKTKAEERARVIVMSQAINILGTAPVKEKIPT